MTTAALIGGDIAIGVVASKSSDEGGPTPFAGNVPPNRIVSAKPVKVQGLANATQVATGEGHACALDKDGAVSCWGHNHHGQLGDGTTADRAQSGSAQDELSGGMFHNCARKTLGAVQCWGSNGKGQLGDGTTENSSSRCRRSACPDRSLKKLESTGSCGEPGVC